MLATLWSILVSLGAPFFFGLPLTIGFLRPKTDSDRELTWILAPLVGVSAIVLLAQNLVYLDVPVRSSAPWLWLLGGAAWTVLLLARQGGMLRRSLPRALLLCALLVYLVQAAGLLIRGVDVYVGRLWQDQFNYTVTAEFLQGHPFSLGYEQAGATSQPVLYKAIQVKNDRIGQSVLHAFVAVSCGLDTKAAFAPVMLSSCFLLVIAVFATARRLTASRAAALVTSVAAGILPAVTLVQIESFLSQMVCMPLLVAWPVVIASLLLPLRWSMLLPAAMVLTAGASIYTEFVPLFFGVLACVLAVGLLRERQGWAARLLACAGLAGLMLAFNPNYIEATLRIVFGRVASAGVLELVYPWSLTLEGLHRIWVGDLVESTRGGPPPWLNGATVAIAVLVYLGWALACVRTRDPALIGCAALTAVPILVRLGGRDYSYQYYKMLLSVAPLLPLGVLALRDALARSRRILMRALRVAFDGCALAATLVAATATADMTVRAGVGTTAETIGRWGFASEFLSPAVRLVTQLLSDRRNANVFIKYRDQSMGSWLAYAARHNCVWYDYDILNDLILTDVLGRRTAFQRVPCDLEVITSSDQYYLTRRMQERFVVGHSGRMEFLLPPFCAWHLSGCDWVFVPEVRGHVGYGEFQVPDWLILGETPIVMTILTPRPGSARFSLLARPGPSLPETDQRRIVVRTDVGYESAFDIAGDTHLDVEIPLLRGRTEVNFMALDRPTLRVLPNGDTRIQMVFLERLRLVHFGEPVSEAPSGLPLVRLSQQVVGPIILDPRLGTAWPIEKVDDAAFLWIGHGPGEGLLFGLCSSRVQDVELVARMCAGHGRTDSLRHLQLTRDGVEVWNGDLDGAGELVIPRIELSAGMNRLCLFCTDEATVTRHENGDERNLLVALRAVFVLPP